MYAGGIATRRVNAKDVGQFILISPHLTPGSGDGGVDIEVTRNGLRGGGQAGSFVNTTIPFLSEGACSDEEAPARFPILGERADSEDHPLT